MERTYEITIKLTVDSKTKHDGIEIARESMKTLGLDIEDVKYIPAKRSNTQNRSLHLLFTQWAEELNKHGLDMRKLLRQHVEIPWSAYTIKEHLWRPIMIAKTGKRSTKDLDTFDINDIYDILNNVIIERSSGEVQVQFPCEDSYMEKMDKEIN